MADDGNRSGGVTITATPVALGATGLFAMVTVMAGQVELLKEAAAAIGWPWMGAMIAWVIQDRRMADRADACAVRIADKDERIRALESALSTANKKREDHESWQKGVIADLTQQAVEARRGTP